MIELKNIKSIIIYNQDSHISKDLEVLNQFMKDISIPKLNKSFCIYPITFQKNKKEYK